MGTLRRQSDRSPDPSPETRPRRGPGRRPMRRPETTPCVRVPAGEPHEGLISDPPGPPLREAPNRCSGPPPRSLVAVMPVPAFPAHLSGPERTIPHRPRVARPPQTISSLCHFRSGWRQSAIACPGRQAGQVECVPHRHGQRARWPDQHPTPTARRGSRIRQAPEVRARFAPRGLFASGSRFCGLRDRRGSNCR